MADDELEPVVILSEAEAKRRYFIYMSMRLAALVVVFGGVYVARNGVTPLALVLIGVGIATLFVRPRMIGLATRPGA